MRHATGADPRSALHTAYTSGVSYGYAGIVRRGCGPRCPRKTGLYGLSTRMQAHRKPRGMPTLAPGSDPDVNSVRMRWARATLVALDGQPAPRIRRMAAADSSALGTNPAAGLSAIRSA
jgi:hypothetical protein